ncbi:hypothetical protein EVAR_24583_1 [Eumeta japonica]|uniref:Uncharacterized protein n=1 Tax=Eumeta variegata TaxID=151549 RepID=A0A4C1W3R7_EUMVA|nr:hypothetical protein EVAR_24583_1 [Eumeta japonica]
MRLGSLLKTLSIDIKDERIRCMFTQAEPRVNYVYQYVSSIRELESKSNPEPRLISKEEQNLVAASLATSSLSDIGNYLDFDSVRKKLLRALVSVDEYRGIPDKNQGFLEFVFSLEYRVTLKFVMKDNYARKSGCWNRFTGIINDTGSPEHALCQRGHHCLYYTSRGDRPYFTPAFNSGHDTVPDLDPGYAFDSNPGSIFNFDPDPVLNFSPGSALDSVFHLDSVFRLAFNFDTATDHNSELYETVGNVMTILT